MTITAEMRQAATDALKEDLPFAMEFVGADEIVDVVLPAAERVRPQPQSSPRA